MGKTKIEFIAKITTPDGKEILTYIIHTTSSSLGKSFNPISFMADNLVYAHNVKVEMLLSSKKGVRASEKQR